MAQRKIRSPRPVGAASRFRRRQIDLGEGGTLVLHGDGAITQTAADGAVVGQWGVDDSEWARHAIRFGLQPQPQTVVPESRRAAEPRPQDG